MNTRRTGSAYEALAAEYLANKGYSIISRNFRCRIGEIDIIAYRARTVVFVEVKYRKTGYSGAGVEAVPFSKQRKICRTADYFRMKHSLTENISYRFDVISIDGTEITHIENAFQYAGSC